MSWQRLIGYILAGVALICLGWLLHSSYIPKPSIEIKETVKTDTLFVSDTVKFIQTKIIEKPIIKDSIRIYADSISGTKNDVAYKIRHDIKDYIETNSYWKVDLEPKLKTVVKYVTRDSVRTITNTEFITKPFFLDNYFYISVFEAILITILVIFK